MAYLIKPVKPADLEVALNLAVLSFENLQRVRGEADALRREMEERKMLERAKGLVMKHGRMSEAEATRRLEALAAAKGLSALGLAQDLIAIAEAFTPPEHPVVPHPSGFSHRSVVNRPGTRPGR
jgi:response regulator NasT